MNVVNTYERTINITPFKLKEKVTEYRCTDIFLRFQSKLCERKIISVIDIGIIYCHEINLLYVSYI